MKKIIFVIFILAVGIVLTLSILKLFRLLDSSSSSLPNQITISSTCGGLITLFLVFKFALFQRIGIERDHYVILVLLLISMNLLFSQNSILNIDRSRSFYILSWVKNNEVSLGVDGALELKVASHESLNTQAIHERLKEQLQRGLIKTDFGRYKLSVSGELTYNLAVLLSNFYDLTGWKKNTK
jgi:hypothetical protein